MRKGYTIDCKYIRRVNDYMTLPRPRKRRMYLIGDGEILPIIII